MARAHTRAQRSHLPGSVSPLPTAIRVPDLPIIEEDAAPGCPKCGAPRAGAACPRCGLLYARWAGAEPLGTGRLETERLWREVTASFHDPARHALFAAHCLHARQLPYAAARYAAEERSPDPRRAAIARERRRRVHALAEAMLLTPPRPPPARDGRPARLVALLGLLGTALLIAWLGLLALGPGARRGPPAPAASAPPAAWAER